MNLGDGWVLTLFPELSFHDQSEEGEADHVNDANNPAVFNASSEVPYGFPKAPVSLH